MKKSDAKILQTLLSGRAGKKYEGKQVVICAGEVYIFPQDDNKSKDFLNELIRKHPTVTPTITFVPKQGTYILNIQS